MDLLRECLEKKVDLTQATVFRSFLAAKEAPLSISLFAERISAENGTWTRVRGIALLACRQLIDARRGRVWAFSNCLPRIVFASQLILFRIFLRRQAHCRVRVRRKAKGRV